MVLLLILAAVIVFGDHVCLPEFSSIISRVHPEPRLHVPLVIENRDVNENGIPDALDFAAGARREVERRTRYDAAYCAGGYPPEGRGACTDVVWRAFREAGYDLKRMVDEDIRKAPAAYGATGRRPDPNIDFRRVKNLVVFFGRHGRELATEVIPGDSDNLAKWQPGDIVVFGPTWEHIGIVSESRLPDGVPLVINNAGPCASESDCLLSWPSGITHHFRFTGEE
ncbi:MAG: DUF1287 domain-containing protein [Ammonifex sp.]|jgi:uncharacterized protein YijF (DUF1287 family)|nr:MAG: DUF1287 domain-containing protein [Ammonifex sp.]